MIGSADPNAHREAAQELAALDAVGALPSHEAEVFQRHLADGCAICVAEAERAQATADLLLLTPAPVAPPESLRARLLRRIRAPRAHEHEPHEREPQEHESQEHESHERESHEREPQEHESHESAHRELDPRKTRVSGPASESGFRTLLVAKSDWQPSGFEGVTMRRLHVDHDRNQVTFLLRVEPGRSFPGHRHSAEEQTYVLQGDVRTGDEVLGPGDFQYAAAGSEHGVQHTVEGCTVLIICSVDDMRSPTLLT